MAKGIGERHKTESFGVQECGALYGAFAGVLTDDISELVIEDSLISFESIVYIKVLA